MSHPRLHPVRQAPVPPGLPLRHIVAALALVAAAAAVAAGAAAAQPEPRDEAERRASSAAPASRFEPAPLLVWNRLIAVFRSPNGVMSPADRARAARRRIEDLPLDLLLKEIEFDEITLEGRHGILFVAGGTTLFGLADEDLDLERGETLESAGEHAQRQLRAVFDARLEQRRPSTVLRGAGSVLAAIFLLGALFVADARARRFAVGRFERMVPSVTARTFGVDLRPAVFSTGRALLSGLAWAVRLLVAYVALTIVLRQIPYTRPWGERLGAYFVDLLSGLGEQMLHAIPGLLAATVIFVGTRLLTRTVDGLLKGAEDETISVSWLHPATIPATRRIVKIIIWLFALTVAYPYLPGSDTAAFKGISVLAGAMLTLGSSGLVTQLMSGLVLIYSRALKPGDLVQIGGTLGTVTEVGILSTKLRTPLREQITIPNAVVISNQVTNFAQEALLSTTVTIGYDAPWRQVHAMLQLAAERTPGLRREPAPFVVQRALSDFYVEYELRCHVERPMERFAVLSVLHGQIQDAFNEFGVQIMAPHFEGQPERPVVVPRDAWHGKPATGQSDV